MEEYKKNGGYEKVDTGTFFQGVESEFPIERLDEKYRSQDKTIMHSDELKKLCLEVMKERGIDLACASVGTLVVFPNISTKRACKVSKCPQILQMYSGFDYTIEVSGEVWDMLDKDTKKMMVYHCLLQIDPTFIVKSLSWKFKLRRPEFATFYTINDKHGNNWVKTIQATVSSLYDLDPRNESEVKV